MNIFETLRDEINQYLSRDDVNAIEQSFLFAKHAHGTQTRYSGEPYITHPIAVASILAEMRMDAPTLIAAILHDVIEDTPIKPKQLISEFGREVATLVEGVTKLTQIQFENYAHAQAENFRKMIMAMANDIRVILIKLADRLHNMRTLHVLPSAKRRRIAIETLEIFAPIANRLGMHAFRIELENLGFSSLHPMRYRIIKKAVETSIGNRREVMERIDQEMRHSLKRGNIPGWTLTGREKHVYSIFKKMHEKSLAFSEIMDVYGFRILVDKIDTCYRVLGVLHNLYKPITQRFKDYIAIPKSNGYQSLHTTLFGPYGVPIEIQIRTEEMHKTAENGIAAHWLYKSNKAVLRDAQSRAREWLKSILEMDKSSKNSLEFIENVKFDLFPDEVYVFTPKGQIIELPHGSTAVDFAYAIHSDIGNTCIAAKIDKKLSPLNVHLESGQQIEIITAPGARPNLAWLNFVASGKARSNIRHFIKKQKHDESIDFGKRLLEKALISFELSLDHCSKAFNNRVLNHFNIKHFSELFEDIGMGHRLAPLVAKQIAKLRDHALTQDPQPIPTPLRIRGTEGMVIHYSECCLPIPGDDITGIMKSGHGLQVHALHCKTLQQLAHTSTQEQWITLNWEDSMQGDFSVRLYIDLSNQRGSLAKLAMAISESESNIETIQARESDKHHFSVKITITVSNRNHLARILKRMRNVKEILHVARDHG